MCHTMLLTFPRMRAHMHACTRNGSNNKNTNNSCTHPLECSGGPIVALFYIVMGSVFNVSHHAPDFSSHARPHARMHAQWQQQQNTNNSCTHSLECSGGPIVAHFNIVMGYRFNFECALLQYTTLYTLKTKTIKPACEKLPLIE